MRDRLHRLIGDLGRFLAVGGAATAVSLLLFNALVHGFSTRVEAPLADHPVPALVLANTVGMVVSYLGARHWVFRHRPTSHADGGVSAFVAINVVTMLIPIACLFVSRDLLGLDDPISDNVAANVVGLGLGVATRFTLFRAFVFRHPITLSEMYDEVLPVDDGPGGSGPGGSSLSASAPTARSTPGPDGPAARAAAAG